MESGGEPRELLFSGRAFAADDSRAAAAGNAPFAQIWRGTGVRRILITRLVASSNVANQIILMSATTQIALGVAPTIQQRAFGDTGTAEAQVRDNESPSPPTANELFVVDMPAMTPVEVIWAQNPILLATTNSGLTWRLVAAGSTLRYSVFWVEI